MSRSRALAAVLALVASAASVAPAQPPAPPPAPAAEAVVLLHGLNCGSKNVPARYFVNPRSARPRA